MELFFNCFCFHNNPIKIVWFIPFVTQLREYWANHVNCLWSEAIDYHYCLKNLGLNSAHDSFPYGSFISLRTSLGLSLPSYFVFENIFRCPYLGASYYGSQLPTCFPEANCPKYSPASVTMMKLVACQHCFHITEF